MQQLSNSIQNYTFHKQEHQNQEYRFHNFRHSQLRQYIHLQWILIHIHHYSNHIQILKLWCFLQLNKQNNFLLYHQFQLQDKHSNFLIHYQLINSIHLYIRHMWIRYRYNRMINSLKLRRVLLCIFYHYLFFSIHLHTMNKQDLIRGPSFHHRIHNV